MLVQRFSFYTHAVWKCVCICILMHGVSAENWPSRRPQPEPLSEIVPVHKHSALNVSLRKKNNTLHHSRVMMAGSEVHLTKKRSCFMCVYHTCPVCRPGFSWEIWSNAFWDVGRARLKSISACLAKKRTWGTTFPQDNLGGSCGWHKP